MKCFIKSQLFCLFIGSLLFFNGCNGDRSSQRKNRHREKTKEFYLCSEAGLSEGQKTQIRELRQNSRSSSHDRGEEEKQAARVELQKHILDTVPVTEEQRAALSECFERRQGRN